MEPSNINRQQIIEEHYEVCIDLLVDLQQSIDKLEFEIKRIDKSSNRLDERGPKYPTKLKDLKNRHQNLLASRAFISDYVKGWIGDFEE